MKFTTLGTAKGHSHPHWSAGSQPPKRDLGGGTDFNSDFMKFRSEVDLPALIRTEPKIATVSKEMEYQGDKKGEENTFHQSADATREDGQTWLLGSLSHQMRQL
ncbi:unnamed protein product [Protopolystoma xenopodis]|uniref:Uncharacterized protein n=1 Tax=Protopolystoma xenopodis TaxID=117903 RepID=A0A3S5CI83_9PLAT|nr:unnamed protein product [Protopolystoma xenopodis]